MKHLICIFSLLFIVGCGISPWEQGKIRRAYIEQNPQLSEETIKCIRYGWLNMGMNGEQVILSIGKPGKIKKSTRASGERETWEYGYFELRNKELPLIILDSETSLFHTKYLYFENGKLIGWQD